MTRGEFHKIQLEATHQFSNGLATINISPYPTEEFKIDWSTALIYKAENIVVLKSDDYKFLWIFSCIAYNPDQPIFTTIQIKDYLQYYNILEAVKGFLYLSSEEYRGSALLNRLASLRNEYKEIDSNFLEEVRKILSN